MSKHEKLIKIEATLSVDDMVAIQEFGEWCAVKERERIIDIIEYEKGCSCRWQFSKVIDQCKMCEIIELIKGEEA